MERSPEKQRLPKRKRSLCSVSTVSSDRLTPLNRITLASHVGEHGMQNGAVGIILRLGVCPEAFSDADESSRSRSRKGRRLVPPPLEGPVNL